MPVSIISKTIIGGVKSGLLPCGIFKTDNGFLRACRLQGDVKVIIGAQILVGIPG